MKTAQVFYYKKPKHLSRFQRNALISVLSENEIKRAYQSKMKGDIENSLLGKYFTRCILASLVNESPSNLVFDENKPGKPRLVYPKIKKLDFNVSHSVSYVVIAVNRTGKVGVDVEKIRSIDLSDFKNYLSKKETSYLCGQKEKKLERFYELWTLKESFIKALGKGLSFPLGKFNLSFDNPSKIKVEIEGKEKGKWRFKTYRLEEKYRLALCLSNNNFPQKLIRLA